MKIMWLVSFSLFVCGAACKHAAKQSASVKDDVTSGECSISETDGCSVEQVQGFLRESEAEESQLTAAVANDEREIARLEAGNAASRQDSEMALSDADQKDKIVDLESD